MEPTVRAMSRLRYQPRNSTSWKRHLESQGVEIEKDMLWPNGARSIYFRDPAGNCLELASPLVWGMEEIQSATRP